MSEEFCQLCNHNFRDCICEAYQPAPAALPPLGNVDQWGCSCVHNDQSRGHVPPCPKAQPAPREWWLRRNKHNNEAYLFETEPPDFSGVVSWKKVHVIEKSCFDELQAKYNFMMESAQQNARERDQCEAKLAVAAKDIEYLSERREAERERAEFLEKTLKGEYLDGSRLIAQTLRERDAARAEVERLKERIEILSRGWPAADILRLEKERDALKEKCERLEQELETERIRLAGCGVAAMLNTRESAKERITPDNPYYSSSYSDVCRAVDAEIALREQAEALAGALEDACKDNAWPCKDWLDKLAAYAKWKEGT